MSDNYGNIYDADPHISIGMGRSYANKTISVNALEMQGLRSNLNANIADLHNLNAMVLTAENNLGDEVLARHNISENLARLRRYIEESENNLTSNYNGLATVMNGFDSADKAIANSFGGVNYQANSMLIAQQYGNYVPVNINGQIILMSIDQINAIYGLESNSQKRGTDLNIFQQMGKGIADAWNKTTTFVTKNAGKLWATAGDIVSIGLSGVAIVGAWAGATAATVGTFGAGVVTYGGVVVVTAYGTNNIANRLTDIFNRWDGDSSNDSEIGNVNYLKSGLTNGIGYLGESIGGETGRAVGETIGKAVYATGEVYSALASAKTYEAGIEGVAKMAGTDSVIGKVVNSQVGTGAMKIAVDKLGLSTNEGEYVADVVDGAIKIAGGDGLSERAYDYLSKSVDTALDIKDYATSYDSFMKSGGELSDVISNSYSSVDSLIEVAMIR